MDMLNSESWMKRKNMQVWRFDKYQIWPMFIGTQVMYDCMYGHIRIGSTATGHEARAVCYRHAQERK
jgi:hypothetical protein